MVVCRKKPNTKCSSVPHRVCELVTMIPYLSVAIPLNTGEGLCMFQIAPWDLPPSDYEEVWKVAGDQVQVTILKYFGSFINDIPRQEPSSNCNKFTQNVCTTVSDFISPFYIFLSTLHRWLTPNATKCLLRPASKFQSSAAARPPRKSVPM